MAKIINPGRRPITLATKHVVPRMGELVTTNDVIQCPDNWPTLNAMFAVGEIGIELDPVPEIVSPVYPTDPVEPEPQPEGVKLVYPTDPIPAEPVPVAETPVYPTDPLPPPEPVAPEAAPVEPAEAITGPVDLPADAIPVKAKK
jgi:hypothetical protein